MEASTSSAEMNALPTQGSSKRPATAIDYPIDTTLLPEIVETSEPAKKARTGRSKDSVESDEPKSNKKELKTSKRAEQNRAAQQAFRARKDERMKELEAKAEKLDALIGQQEEMERLRLELKEREKVVKSQEMNKGQGGKVHELEEEIKRCVCQC